MLGRSGAASSQLGQQQRRQLQGHAGPSGQAAASSSSGKQQQHHLAGVSSHSSCCSSQRSHCEEEEEEGEEAGDDGNDGVSLCSSLDAGTCAICMDSVAGLSVSGCCHTLCLQCAYKLCCKAKGVPLCPFCRQSIGGFDSRPAGVAAV